jgi:PAS domain S-box-containing protein
MNNLATPNEIITGQQVKRVDHASIVNQHSTELTEDKKPDVKELEGEIKRLKAEIEIRKRSKEVFEAFFDNTIFAVVILDSNYNFIRVNDVYAKACSRDVSDFTGHNHFEFYPSDAKEIFDQVVKTKESYKVWARPFVFHDHPEWGTTYWDWTLVPVLDSTGEAELLIFTLNDVTEHVRTQEKLSESEERYRSIFNNSIDGILLTTPDGITLSANPSVCRMFGRTEEEMCSIDRDGIADLEDTRVMKAVMERDKTGVLNTEMTVVHKDGTKLPVEVTSSLFEDKDGRILYNMIIRDITKRKKSEEALRLSEEKFSKTFYNNQTMMGITRLKDGVCVDVNDTFVDIMGYNREEVIGKSAFEVCVWHDQKKRQEMLNQLFEKGYIRNYEHKYRKKTGEIGFALSSFNFMDVNGEKCLLSSVIDITERKKAEEALCQSEERFYKSFHSSPAMMSITRLKDNIFIDVNNSFSNALGYRREEMIGHSPLELNVWFEQNKREDMVETIIKEGSIKIFESKFIKKSGEIGYVLSSLDIVNLNGDDCLLGIGIDITERIKAEEALRKSQELFGRAFDLAPFSLVITSLKDGNIKKVNQRFLQSNGYSEEEVIGHSAIELNFWFDPGERAEMLKQLEEKEIYFQELKLRKKDGKVIDVMFTGGKINLDGEECLITMQKDITELKTYQTEIARLDRLNLIGEMAAGIGHEVRNPMTTVKGFLQLLKEKERYAQDRDTMDLMIEELDRANSIITEFLSLAKNKAVELKMQSLNQKIKTILPLIQADAMKQDKNIELELGDIPNIKIDKNEIQQLVLNLVRNGLEAMPPGGVLTIKTFLEGDRVVLAVKDQGRGIALEVLEKIGTPFFTTKDNGTGLGLAVCYSIAERQNARIDIETGSEGTAFFVRFKG